MKVEGRCHCGKIEYEADVDETKVQICHCLDCQILTGSAFRVTIPASPESFRVKKGEARIYYKTADSGSRRGHAFCGECGSPSFDYRQTIIPIIPCASAHFTSATISDRHAGKSGHEGGCRGCQRSAVSPRSTRASPKRLTPALGHKPENIYSPPPPAVFRCLVERS